MHESTRRTVCRVAFLALCVAPMVAVLAWAANVRSPSRVENAERELAAALELAVSIDDITHPRPGVTVYSGISLSDPETRRVVAEIATLEATELAGGVLLVSPRGELDATHLDRLWCAIERLLRIGRDARVAPVRMSVERLTLHGADGDAITLANVTGQLTCGDEVSRAGLRFSLPGAGSSEPALLVADRAHGKGSSATRLEVRTGGSPLPLAVARTVFPALAHLGDRVTFSGQLWASNTHRDSEAWSGEVTGRLTHVDLDACITRQFSHKISGDAQITLQKLAFADGRVARLVGRLDAGPGVVGRSLLEAAANSLGMRTAESGGNDRDPIEYEQLAFAFDVDAHEARLEGTCEAPAKDDRRIEASLCVMRDSFGPILLQADRQPQPSLGLVRMLVPKSDLQVPASRQTDWLLRRMPIPAARSSSPDTPPRATLRDATPIESSRD